MKHITKIIIFIQIVIIIILCISIPRYYKRMEMLENHNTYLEFQLSTTSRELKNTQHKLIGANQELENLTINFMANELMLKDLKSRYIRLSSYAIVAQEILLANNINFRMTESVGIGGE